MDKISIIIPVYNESVGLPALFSRIAPFAKDSEVIFADGGSTDDTAKIITNNGYKCLSAPKGRANQMNHGAKAASGNVLWFLHADSIPPIDALSQIRKVLSAGNEVGCFPIRFSSSHPLMFVNAILSNMRVRLFNIAFGDQGIFVKASLFKKIGGYAQIPLMEDLQFSKDAQKLNHKITLTKKHIITSDRRYRTNGRLRTMLQMKILQHRFRRGDSIEEIAAAYNSMKS